MGALDSKVIAITGAGRGIGRAVALACAAEGAAVIVNDYGVSIDGNEPSSEVADGVVAEITAAGGRAAANAQSVTTMEGGASIVNDAVDQLRPHRRRRVRRRHPARADALQHVRSRVGPGDRDAPQGRVHGVPRRGPDLPGAEERHDARLHVRSLRGEHRPGELLGGQGRDRLARAQRGRGHEQVRRDRELHRTRRQVAHVGQRAVRPRDG